MKKLPRIIATATLAGAVFASASPLALAEELPSSQTTEQEPTNLPFTDVTPRYKDAVSFLYSNGFARGVTKTQFGVNQQLKRVDAAMMVAKYANLIPGSKQAPFTDLPQRAVPMVSAIYDAGLMMGKSATLFGSNDSMKRGEAAILLYHLLPSTSPSKTADMPFTDVSERYATAIEKLVAHDIVQGKTATRFGTEDNLTRGELAIMLYRINEASSPAAEKFSSHGELPSSSEGLVLKTEKEIYSRSTDTSTRLSVTQTGASSYYSHPIFILEKKQGDKWQIIRYSKGGIPLPVVYVTQPNETTELDSFDFDSSITPITPGEYRWVVDFYPNDEPDKDKVFLAAYFTLTE